MVEMTSVDKQRVAVIGAGLTGISALRRLCTNRNLQLTCFEKNYELGGLWLYTDKTVEDDYGQPIRSAMYNYLRTNVPKELMEIEGFPMDDYTSFPCQRDILGYLNKIAGDCGIRKYIKFNTEVKSVKPAMPDVRDTKWLVEYSDVRKKGGNYIQEFDVVIVCVGNCTTSNYPTIDDEEKFNGLVIHSLRYRRPEMFAGQTVAVLGANYSGTDISYELSKYAKKVYLCHRNQELETKLPENIIQKTFSFQKFKSTSIVLENGEELPIDAAIYCTGFKYDFSILPDGLLKINQHNLVCNLYKYIIPARYSSLYFMGIPRGVTFFPSSDRQALFILAAIEGSARIPPQKEMEKIIAEDSNKVLNGYTQWEYDRELSEIAGNFKPFPKVYKKIWDHHFNVWAVDFGKCRSLSYKITGLDSFVQT